MIYLDWPRRTFARLCSMRWRSLSQLPLRNQLSDPVKVKDFDRPLYVAIFLNLRPPSITSWIYTSVESPTDTIVFRSGENDASEVSFNCFENAVKVTHNDLLATRNVIPQSASTSSHPACQQPWLSYQIQGLGLMRAM